MDSKATEPVEAVVPAEGQRKAGRRIRFPCMRMTSKPSEIQSASNGSDRTAEPASRQDIESARLKKEKAELRALRWMRRRKNCVNIWKRFVAFLLSTVGLTVAMVFYTIIGGLAFQWIEAPEHTRAWHWVKCEVNESLWWHLAELWKVTEEMNVLYRENWTAAAEEIVRNYTRRIVRAAKVEGWDGPDKESSQQWSFASSMLYSATVITTIGILAFRTLV